MTTDKMRQKFEAGCPYNKQRVSESYAMPDGRILVTGDYLYYETYISWTSYKSGWNDLLAALGDPVCRVTAEGVANTSLPESTPLYALLKENK